MGVKTCCFCFDLKHGTISSATFTLVTKLIAVVALSAFLGVVHKQYNDSRPNSYVNEEYYQSRADSLQFTDIFLGIIIGICALEAFFSVMLLIGVRKSIKCLFWPWMIFIGLEISGSITFFIRSIFMINYGVIHYSAISLIGAIFNLYMLWCVKTYYKTLPVINMQNQPSSNESNEAFSENPPPYKFDKETSAV